MTRRVLVDAIIAAYHTTRLSSTDAATHILSKQYVKQAFHALGVKEDAPNS